MDEKTLDLKTEGEKPSEGNGQPEQKTPESDLESEIVNVLTADNEPGDIEDDTVVLSKREVEKLKKERDNYKAGLLSLKDKVKPKKPAPAQETIPEPKGDVPQWFAKVNEQKAIAEACKDESVEKNWSEIMRFFTGKRGRATVEAIIADIDDAKTLFEKHSNKSEAKAEDNKEVAAELAAEKAKSTTTTQKGEQPKKKSILPKQEPITNWYP